MRLPKTLACTVALLWPLAPTHAALINFDGLVDGEAVASQFEPGVNFSRARVITAGISLNEFEFPPQSGANVVFDDGGPMTLSFLQPLQAFGGHFTYLHPLKISVLDSLGAVITTLNSAFNSNMALSGDLGSAPNEFLGLSGLTALDDVTRIVITGDTGGSSFTLDDLSYSFAVPEPSGIGLAGLALLAMLRVARQRPAQQGQRF